MFIPAYGMGNEQTKYHLHYDCRRVRCSSGRLPVCRIRELDRPELEYALAQCEINAMSTEQGMFAMGTPGYGFNAQLGNAITNEVRRREYLRRCMVLNGWRQGPSSTARAGAQQFRTPTTIQPGTLQQGRPPTRIIAGQ